MSSIAEKHLPGESLTGESLTGELWAKPAREVVALLKKGEVSPGETMQASLARIEAVNGTLNAVPTLSPERAESMIAALAQAPDKDHPGWLAGLPVLIKDLTPVKDVRCTYGSPLFADNVATFDDLFVRSLADRGAVLLGKTNTPEFGAGANTFNEVFGATVNPWNTALTCGGSSGGAAVSLASGMAWLASGSDLGGSLRIPAAFTGVVGLRPSPGRVPHKNMLTPFSPLSVEGPMARDMADLALFLEAMAKFQPEDPWACDSTPGAFLKAFDKRCMPKRVAFSMDLGIAPIDPAIRKVTEAAIDKLRAAGVDVVDVPKPLLDAFSISVPCFQAMRAAQFAARMEPLLEKHRDQLKPEVIWNIEKGMSLTAGDLGLAERQRAVLIDACNVFFEDHDLLLTPATIVPPFPIEQRFIDEVNGHKFDNYIEWLLITFALTLTACPSLSLPCGFTDNGLPVGLQMMGPPRGEAPLITYAAAIEEDWDFALTTPIDPKGA